MEDHGTEGKAELVAIKAEADSPWNDLVPLYELTAPYPEIKKLPPGQYELHWDFSVQDLELVVQFDVLDKNKAIVDTLEIAAFPYFSGPLVTMRVTGRRAVEPTLSSLKRVLAKYGIDEKTLKSDPINLANIFMEKQSRAFRELMNQWIDFKNHEKDLANLGFVIATSIDWQDGGHHVGEALTVLP
jgi:hypothetical protein